jgi:hypothetical protein
MPSGRSYVRDPRSYVVRVYRQVADVVAGTVQDVGTGRTMPFQTMEELWYAVIARPPRSEARSSGTQRTRRPAAGAPDSTQSDRRRNSDDDRS